MNYWYVARTNELFLDIDNVSKSIKHARARLQGAIECGKLDVAYIMQRPSHGKDHLHVIVTLNLHDLQKYHVHDRWKWDLQKQVWEIILHGDIYRGCCNIMRVTEGIDTPSVLISPYPTWIDIDETGTEAVEEGYVINATVRNVRHANDSCDCKSKHNAATMKTCPAAIRLRGEFRNAGFFGKPSKNPCTIWPEL